MHLDEIRQPRRTVIAGAGLGLAATALAAVTTTADVPVGSGVIVDDIVVTQPTAGVFKGFSSVCPHAGCNVSSVENGNIVCPCHGRRFDLAGAVVKGPAPTPL